MILSDLPQITGLILGGFAFGYAASWLFYVFRKVALNIT